VSAATTLPIRRGPKVDLSGRRFGNLVAIEFVDGRWMCSCACGATVRVPSGNLTSHARHGHTRPGKLTPEYQCWINMVARCGNANHPRFADWGGRGIAVCKAWRESFEQFLADMGPRPAGRSIDRIDNDGNYEPGNVRWATRSQQMSNQRRAKRRAAS